jgi:hypothetical protein
LVVASLLALDACSGDSQMDATVDSGAADVATDVDLTTHFRSFCTQMVAAVHGAACAYYQRCCTVAERADPSLAAAMVACQGIDTEVAACVSRIEIAVSRGHAVFDTTMSDACIGAVWGSFELPDACDEASSVPQILAQFDPFALTECMAALYGTGSDGAKCLDGIDCATGYCAPGIPQPGVATLGECAPAPEEGDVCGDTPACPIGTTCVDAVCRAPGNVGDDCAADADCQPGLCCASQDGDGGATMTCAERLGDGEPCALAKECQSARCVSGTCLAFCAAGVEMDGSVGDASGNVDAGAEASIDVVDALPRDAAPD